MKTLILVLLLLSGPVCADWTVHTVSHHFVTSGMNNFNPYDITKDISIAWFGEVINLELKF